MYLSFVGNNIFRGNFTFTVKYEYQGGTLTSFRLINFGNTVNANYYMLDENGTYTENVNNGSTYVNIIKQPAEDSGDESLSLELLLIIIIVASLVGLFLIFALVFSIYYFKQKKKFKVQVLGVDKTSGLGPNQFAFTGAPEDDEQLDNYFNMYLKNKLETNKDSSTSIPPGSSGHNSGGRSNMDIKTSVHNSKMQRAKDIQQEFARNNASPNALLKNQETDIGGLRMDEVQRNSNINEFH